MKDMEEKLPRLILIGDFMHITTDVSTFEAGFFILPFL